MKILLIQLRQLGDILLTTPCITSLRKAYPKAQIDFLCHPMGKLVLKDNPDLNQVLFYESNYKFILSLRKIKYDIVLDFMANPRSAFYTTITGAPKKIAFKTRRALFYDTVVESPKNCYIATQKHALLEAIGVKEKSTQLVLPCIEPIELPKNEYIVISPTHRRPRRQWPLAFYAELSNRWNMPTYILWGPGEEEVAKELKRLNPKLHICPKTTFAQMAYFIKHAKLFIGNSNGPSHVAVAMGTPSFQIHGHTDLISWCPMNGLHTGIQGPDDLTQLSVDLVFKALDLTHMHRWK